jgi:hypothetical protein
MINHRMIDKSYENYIIRETAKILLKSMTSRKLMPWDYSAKQDDFFRMFVLIFERLLPYKFPNMILHFVNINFL